MKSDQAKHPDIKVFDWFLTWYYFKVIKLNASIFLAHICYTIALLFLEQSTYCYCCLRKKLLPLRLKVTTAEGLGFHDILQRVSHFELPSPPPLGVCPSHVNTGRKQHYRKACALFRPTCQVGGWPFDDNGSPLLQFRTRSAISLFVVICFILQLE